MRDQVPPLIVVSRLGRSGETGVQKHVEMVLRHAATWGMSPRFVAPGEGPQTLRRMMTKSAALLRLVHPELGQVWWLWGATRLLRSRVSRVLRRQGSHGAVVYAQDPITAAGLTRLRRHWPTVRVVLCAHYNISEAHEVVERGRARPGGLVTRYLDEAEREAVRECDAIIFPSEFSRRCVMDRLGTDALGRMHVVPHVVELTDSGGGSPSANTRDVSHPTGAVHEELDKGWRPDLISLGTLEPRKNQGFLIDLLAAVRERGVPARLTLVGHGELRTQLEEHASRKGVGEVTTFAGLVVPGWPLIKDHAVYVHAARMESFGIVLVEALAQGRPVAVAPVGGVPEVVRDGVEGIYLRLDDVEASADALADLLSDRDRYARLSAAARARYESAFSPTRLLRQWRDVILGERFHSASEGWPTDDEPHATR